MSKTIDSRMVEMKFDTEDFSRGVSSVTNGIKKVNEGLKSLGTNRDLNGLNESINKVSFSGLESAVENISNKFSNLGIIGITALQNITNKAVDAGISLVKSLSIDQISSGFSKYEQLTQATQMIVNQGYGMNKVENALEKLMWFTDETSYSFVDMANNIGKFTANGRDLSESVTAMEGISNWAALSGAGIQGASRAMYNLSQALGLGAVRVQDWMSIENANMATKEFKETAIETAVALGKLEEGVVDYATFRSSLGDTKGGTANWLDSDVLIATLRKYGDFTDELYKATEKTGLTATDFLRYIEQYKNGTLNLQQAAKSAGVDAKTLSKYIKELSADEYEFGVKGFKAAQEATTFTQAIDAIKDAVSTGWMKSFNVLFGNYEKAKVLWTDLANELYDVFASGSERRNELLFDSMTSNWDKVQKSISSTNIETAAFQESLKETAAKHGIEVDKLVTKYGSFQDSLQDGWLTIDLVKETTDGYIKSLDGLSDAELSAAGYTRDDVEAMKELSEQLKSTDSDVGSLFKDIARVGGRDNLIDAFWDIFHSITDVISVAKDAFSTIFPPATAEQIYNITEKIKAFAASLRTFYLEVDGEQVGLTAHGQMLKNTFQGFFAIIDIGWKTLKAFASLLSPLRKLFDQGKYSVLGVTGSLGEYLTALDKVYDPTKLFGGIIEKLTKAIDWLTEKILNIRSGLTSFKETIDESFKGISKKTEEVSVFSSAMDFLSTVLEKLKSVASSAFDKIVDGLKKFASALNINGLADFVSILKDIAITGVLTSFSLSINNLGKGFSDFISKAGAIPDTFSKIKDGIETLTQQKDLDNLLTVAASITLLAISVNTLSNANVDNLGLALTALGASLTEMLMLMKSMEGLSLGKGSSGDLIKLASAVLILSESMKILSTIDSDSLTTGIIGFSVVLGELTAMMIILGKQSGTFDKSTNNLIGLASALVIIAGALKIIGTMDLKELGPALAAVTVLIAELTLAIRNMDSSGAVAAGLAIIEMANGILILSGAIAILGNLKLETLGKGLAAITALIGELVLAINLMNPNDAIASGFAMIEMANAMLLLSGAVAILGNLKLETLAKGVGALTVMLVELFAFCELTNPADLIATSTALIIAAGALGAIAAVISILGAMPLENIIKSLVALGVALVGMGVAATVLAPMSVAILEVSAAILVFSAALTALGIGLAAIGLGIESVVAGFIALGAITSATLNLIVTNLTNFISVVIPAFIISLIDGIKGTLTSIISLIKDTVLGIINMLIEIAPQLFELVKVLLSGALDILIEYTPKIAEAGLDILLSLLKSIDDNMEEVTTTALSIMVNFLNGIAKKLPAVVDAGFNLIISFINGLADSIRKNTDRMNQAMVNLITSMIQAAVKVATTGVDIGTQLAEGIKKGIRNKLESVKQSAINMVSGAVSAVKNFLGIKSPSRVFAEIGQFSIMGLVEGIEDNTKKAVQAAENSASDTVNAFGDSLSHISQIVGDEVDINPTITPTLDLSDVRRSANTVGSLFNSQQIGVTGKFGSVSYDENGNPISASNKLLNTIKGMSSQQPNTYNNVFNITGDNPREIADEVSRILQQQVERKEAIWA